MRRTISVLLAAGMLAALLAGCGQAAGENAVSSSGASSESGEPTPEPSPSATPSPTPSPTPTETPTPTPPPEEGYAPGVCTDTDYTNESLGLRFVPSDSMVMVTSEDFETLFDLTLDFLDKSADTGTPLPEDFELSATYEMAAIDVTGGSTVIIVSEKLPAAYADMTVEEYLDLAFQQAGLAGGSAAYGEPEPMELCGVDFTAVHYTMDLGNGLTSGQSLLLKKIDDQIVAVTLSYPDTTTRDALLGCFTSLGIVTV